MGRAEPGVALRPGPHSFFARHHVVAAAPAGELLRSAKKGAAVGDAIAEELVNYCQCRYRFRVEVAPDTDWRIEAQCPSCESWASFTAADTLDLPRPDPAELEAEAQRLGELLWQPINEYRSHPAVAWMDRVGNGLFEDDHSPICWPLPHRVYRFTHGSSAAYIWQKGSSWFFRGWHSLRGRGPSPEPAEVFSFVAALDRLSA